MILNINSKLDNYEFKLCENLNQILNKIKGDTNKIACSKLESSLKDCGEWLFDYVEYSENEISFKTDALTAGLYFVVIADVNGKEIAKEKLVNR